MAMARVWAVKKKEVMRSDDDGNIVLDVMCSVFGECGIGFATSRACSDVERDR